jgi:hypothetical protein
MRLLPTTLLVDVEQGPGALMQMALDEPFEKKFRFRLATAVVTYSSFQAIVGFSS